MAGEVKGTPIKSSEDKAWKLAVAKQIQELVDRVAVLEGNAKSSNRK